MCKISVLVVNINNLNYTKNCINDLLNQTRNDFNITLIDQGSIESGTNEYLNSLPVKINIIRNKENISLNKIWNDFYENNNTEYLCYLNNDVKLTDNFIEDTINILDRDNNVGIVIHSTNNFKYNKKLNELDYRFTKRKIKQGWDFTIRKKLYIPIPSILKFYFGDDWLFHHVYEQNYNVAVCISSPIIHYAEKSSKYSPVSWLDEINNFKSLGMERYLPHYNEYNDVKSTFIDFGDNSIDTIISYNRMIEDVYYENDVFNKLNTDIIEECNTHTPNIDKLSSITQLLKDNIKIKVSVVINNAISNGYKKWGICDPLIEYTLPLYLEHLPNLKIVE